MEEYNIKLHGDLLEKEYSSFIQTDFKAYEAVWKLYIGNNGSDQKAELKSRTTDQEINRQLFSEHTYTVLQSVILLNRLRGNSIFSASYLKDTKEVLDLQDALILFFTHIGRIIDNVKDASTYLNIKITKQILKTFKSIYYKRNVIVHGKTIPMIYKSDGAISIPVIAINSNDPAGWNHMGHQSWAKVKTLKNEPLSITISQLYFELLAILNNVFGDFWQIIEEDLANTGSRLYFEHNPQLNSHLSSSYEQSDVVDVYGLGKLNLKTNR